jgi:Caspase domain
MRGRFFRILVLLLIGFVAASPSIAQGRRVALVIGNSEYKHTPRLDNPKHDAADMATTLGNLGFAVMEGRDLDKASMDLKIRDFAQALRGAQVGLFFYSGHGLQVAGQNYLVPIDAELTTASAIDFDMVRLDLVHRAMERETNTNILIMDACRDNPLARNLARALGTRSAQIGRGFAPMESGEGTLIGFSTQPGNVALDGTGRNSPYVAALLKYMTTPGDDVSTILINVRNDVMQATGRRQVPWEHSAMTARFYFVPAKTTAQQVELEFWASVKDSTSSAVLGTYLERYPNGEFAPIARALSEQYERRLKSQLALEAEVKRLAASKAAEDAPKAAEANATKREPEEILASSQFDGTWRVEWSNNQHCRRKTDTANWTVSKGLLVTGGGHRGTVDGGGQLLVSYPCRLNPGKTCRIQARLQSGHGAGNFFGRDGCGGKVTFTRM